MNDSVVRGKFVTRGVLELATSQEDFESLWRSVYGVREDVGVCTVNKKALYHLLYDHAQLVGAIEDDKAATVLLEDGMPDAQHEAFIALRKYRDVVIENEPQIKQESMATDD